MPPQDVGALHPHHQYADTHRPGDLYTYRVADRRSEGGGVVPIPLASAAASTATATTTATRFTYSVRGEGPAAAALAEVARQHSVADGAVFQAAVAKLAVERQHALLEHAQGVAQHLQVGRLGVWRGGCGGGGG